MSAPALKVTADSPALGVRRIALNRPESLNAIDEETRAGLQQALEDALADDGIKSIILTGMGANFSAGGDIRYMRQLEADAFTAFHGRLLHLCRIIGGADKPIVGAVRGACAGGAMGLALACDQLLASTTTRFLIPFMRIGLTPDMALPYWLARRVGPQTARHIVLQDEPVLAERALTLGMCDQLSDDAALEEMAVNLASRLADRAPLALRQTRSLLRDCTLPFEDYLEAERIAASTCLGSPEFHEGVAAFLEKRRPLWPQSNAGES
ncbi:MULTISPECIES: enoyl-CoA hydratase/isomerase family protein [Sphingobium]|uniref:enoyl-CoA hydratase/isomerase family protein n=1 Tax=Sphingobium TaxID=165695 RepID=UPI00159C1052|nr:enoyl-CoA hydratase/isomerase family protein [Sphingobium sp. 15-1]